jgi:hypothetical protein
MQVRPLGSEPGKAPVIRMWPLLHTEPEPTLPEKLDRPEFRGGYGHFTLAWPFIQSRYKTDADGNRWSSFGLHPLFARTKKPNRLGAPGEITNLDVIWPIYQSERKIYENGTRRFKYFIPPLVLRQTHFDPRDDGTGTYRKRFFIFPFFWSGSTHAATPDSEGKPIVQGERSWYWHLVPFVWLARGEIMYLPQYNPDARSYSLYWPFYGKINYGPEGSNWTTRFFLWPLIIWSRSTDDPTKKSLSVLWPIFRVQWGGVEEKLRELKIWPLLGYKTQGDKFRHYLLWPFFIWRNASTEDEVDKQKFFFPFYIYSQYKDAMYRIWFWGTGSYRDENESARFILWPLYAKWKHEGKQFNETQIFWRFIRWRHEYGEEKNTFRQVGPFYRYFNIRGREEWWRPMFLWEGSRRTRFDGMRRESYEYSSRYHLPFFFSKKRQYSDDRLGFSRFLILFFLWQNQPDGESHVRGLWPLWQEDFEGFNRNWTPLWVFYEFQRDVLKQHPPKKSEASPVEAEPAGDDAKAMKEENTGEIIPEKPSRFSLFGYLYRSESAPGYTKRQMNLGPFTYDQINGRHAVSIVGGWLPITWGREQSAE